jgi:hypothetical protein
MKIDRYYQWLPNSGFDNEIVKLVNVYEDSGVMFYEFSNGEVCNEEFVASFTKEPKALQGKMLVELSSRKDTWQFEKITSRTINTGQGDIMSPDGRAVIKEIPPLEDIASAGDSDTVNTSVGRVRLIAPKTMVNSIPPIDYKDYIKVEEKKEIVEIKEEKITEKVEEVFIEETPKKENINKSVVETDPVAILVNASAKNKTVIPMELNVELPTVDLFNIASKNFENGAEKFIDVVLSHINYDMLKDALKTALLEAYSSGVEDNKNI